MPMGLAASPDGAFLVYESPFNPGILLRKSTADALDGTPITSAPASAMYPVYSPDNMWIYYINSTDMNKIYQKSATDTLNGTAITISSALPAAGLAISPD